jgi:hypothetical protein
MPWSTQTIAGHPCDLYLPPERNKHGYVALYLHGVHLNRLDDKPAFIAQFDRHGLAVVAPQTKRSWWTDKICNEFDRTISAEQHVLRTCSPSSTSDWAQSLLGLASLVRVWAGRVHCA